MDELSVPGLTFDRRWSRRAVFRALTAIGIAEFSAALHCQVAPSVPSLSVCGLFRNLRSYRRRTIRLSGKLHTWYHGLLLYERECRHQFLTGEYAWPTVVSLTTSQAAKADGYEVQFRTEMDSYGPLHGYYEETRRLEKGYILNIVVEGELRTREEYTASKTAQGWTGNGFGPLSSSPAELVVKRFVEVTVDRKLDSVLPNQR